VRTVCTPVLLREHCETEVLGGQVGTTPATRDSSQPRSCIHATQPSTTGGKLTGLAGAHHASCCFTSHKRSTWPYLAPQTCTALTVQPHAVVPLCTASRGRREPRRRDACTSTHTFWTEHQPRQLVLLDTVSQPRGLHSFAPPPLTERKRLCASLYSCGPHTPTLHCRGLRNMLFLMVQCWGLRSSTGGLCHQHRGACCSSRAARCPIRISPGAGCSPLPARGAVRNRQACSDMHTPTNGTQQLPTPLMLPGGTH
jgi:hypothetical protein